MKRDSKTYSKVPEVTLGFWIIKILATSWRDWRRYGHHDMA